MVGYLDRVNRTRVSIELLVEVVQMHAAMPAADRPVYEARALRMFELLRRKGLRTGKIAATATAIDFRLAALARLERDAALRGWSLPGGENGMALVSFDVLRAAATEPLIENPEGQAAFDAEKFRRRVLEGAEPDGRA